MNMNVQLDEGAYIPVRFHKQDAGADLFTPYSFILRAGDRKVIDTGVHIELPKNCAGFIKSKSGLMVNDGILTDGLIDEGYGGSIRVCLFNHSRAHKQFKAGQKIGQLVIVRVEYPEFEQVAKVEAGQRGNNGFGSTGK